MLGFKSILPGTTPLVAIALMEIAVSMVCRRGQRHGNEREKCLESFQILFWGFRLSWLVMLMVRSHYIKKNIYIKI